MESDWSVAATADDPVIETGWADAATDAAWSDLRTTDAALRECRIAALPEAASSPALARALDLFNAPRGLLMTSKCDRWPMSSDELAELAVLLDQPQAACGIGSYIDVLMAHTLPMQDFLLHEEWGRLASRFANALTIENARVEFTVRPALHADTWGFGISVYCYGSGADLASADAAWAASLDAIAPLVIRAADELVPPANEIGG